MSDLKPEKIIILCETFPQAEFEFGLFLEYLNAQYEPILYINDSALIVKTDQDIEFKFMGERWFPFLKNLDEEHTEVMDLQEFVETTYGTT